MNTYPDIGPDPLKLEAEAWRQRGHIDNVRAALCHACAIQQKEVPDQTALVWRIDLSRLLDDHTVLQARWKTLKPTLEQALERLKKLEEFRLNVVGHTMALAHGDPVENLLTYIEKNGQP